MRRWLGYGLLGLFAYLTFVIIQLPATALLDQVAQRVPGFTLQEIQGSALRGSARGIRLGASQLESLSWRLRFTPLFLGRLEYRVELTEPDLKIEGNAATNWNRQIFFNDLKGGLPLSKLTALMKRPSLPLNGRVELDALELKLDPAGRPRMASGTVRLLDAYSSLGKPLELGSFRIDLDTKEQAIVANIKDSGGPLEFTGLLTLAPDGNYRFNGQAGVRDDNNRELHQALSILGRPGGDGKWKIDLTGLL